ncbi:MULTISPECIES: putative ABC transporter permease subunit [unclassified Nitrospina]|uniref:putative ABC transporter permease subunit n=1 Tax=unclassified Nitrospina TaxID=2638683 RepID=UPI003F9A3DC0
METIQPWWVNMRSLSAVRLKFMKNHFGRPNRDKVTRWLLIGTLGTLFLIADYVFFYRMVAYLDGLPLRVGEELIVQLLNVVFLTLFAMLLFSTIIAALAIYYVSSDLEFLHSLPMVPDAIIHVRFVQTLINASWVVLVFSLPMFIAYGYYFKVTASYYVYLIASFLPFVVLPCALGVLGIMVLMRFFPTDKAHQILSFLGLFFVAGLVAFLRFLSPEKFFDKKVSDEVIIDFVESLRVPEFPYLPSSWITRGLTAWTEGNIEISFGRLGFLYAAAGVGLVLFAWISRRIYFSGWRSYQEVKNAPRTRKRNNGHRKPLLAYLPIGPMKQALISKDLKVFARDPAHWSQIFILLVLVIVYIFNIMNLPLDNLVLKNVVSVLNIGLIGFVLSALIARFVFSSISIEGKKMWTLYTAPVDMRHFLVAKFWMYWPPLLVVAEILTVASNYLLQVDAYVMKMSIIGVMLITTGLVGMGVGMGAMYPRFDHENMSEISTGTGGILFMISSLAYVMLVLVLSARPMYVHFNEKFLFKFVGGIEVPVFYGMIVVLTVLVTWIPMKRGIRALRTMDI